MLSETQNNEIQLLPMQVNADVIRLNMAAMKFSLRTGLPHAAALPSATVSTLAAKLSKGKSIHV